MRIEFERAQVLTLRQQEWDAANSYLFGALLGSIRDLDHAIIRAHQGDGASAWQALRAVYAGADSTRSGLISSLDALKRLQCPAADNFAQTADKVSVQIGYIRNNQLIQNSTASDLLDVIQLATTMQMLSLKPLYAGLVTTLRTDENLTLATLRAKVTEFERVCYFDEWRGHSAAFSFAQW